MQARDELIARLMAGENVPEADEATRREAALFKLAIERAIEAEVSPEQLVRDKAQAFERARRYWATLPSEPISANTAPPAQPTKPATDTGSTWLGGILGVLQSLIPRPAAWAFASIAVAVVGITMSIQYRGQHQDDPFQMRGGQIQTVTLAVPSPAASAEQIRAALTAAGLKTRVRSEGVFQFVDIVEIPQPPDSRTKQAFAALNLPPPVASRIEIGLRPAE